MKLLTLLIVLAVSFVDVLGSLNVRHTRHLPSFTRRSANQTRDTLDRIIRTYEWQQYKFQGLSCRNTPVLNTVCSEFSYGNGIPTHFDIEPNGYSTTYRYLYTYVDFYGFSLTNYTILEPKLLNLTAQAMYYFCQVNTTCASAYKATPNIAQSLLSLLQQNSNRIKANLQSSSPSTWVPNYYLANALPYLTTFPPSSTEIMGVQEGVLLAANNYSSQQLQSVYAAGLYWSFGAEMFEAMINAVALIGLDTYTNATTYAKRADFSAMPQRQALNSLFAGLLNVLGGESAILNVRLTRDKMLQRIKTLRGRERLDAMLQYNSTTIYQALGLKSSPIGSKDSTPLSRNQKRAACSRTARTTFYQLEADNFASDACRLENVPKNFFALPSTNYALANGPFYKASSLLSSKTSYYFNDVLAVASFVNVLCTSFPKNLPCYPTANVWSTSGKPGYGVQTIFDVFNVTAAINANTKPSQPSVFNIECTIDDLVQQTYKNAINCCKKNCNNPACIAGYLGSISAGPGC